MRLQARTVDSISPKDDIIPKVLSGSSEIQCERSIAHIWPRDKSNQRKDAARREEDFLIMLLSTFKSI